MIPVVKTNMHGPNANTENHQELEEGEILRESFTSVPFPEEKKIDTEEILIKNEPIFDDESNVTLPNEPHEKFTEYSQPMNIKKEEILIESEFCSSFSAQPNVKTNRIIPTETAQSSKKISPLLQDFDKSVKQHLDPTIKVKPVVSKNMGVKLLLIPCPLCLKGCKIENLRSHLTDVHSISSGFYSQTMETCLLCLEQVEAKKLYWHSLSSDCKSKSAYNCKITFEDYKTLKDHMRDKNPTIEKIKLPNKPHDPKTNIAEGTLKLLNQKNISTNKTSVSNKPQNTEPSSVHKGTLKILNQKNISTDKTSVSNKPENTEPSSVQKEFNNAVVVCPVCSIIINQISDLSNHLTESHKKELVQPEYLFTCMLCKTPIKYKDICDHVLSSVCLGKRSCYYCKIIMRDWEDLKKHLQTRHWIYCCNDCNAVCGSKSKYATHIKSKFHSFNISCKKKCDKGLIKTFCPLCPIGVVVHHLKLHLRVVHSDIMVNPEKIYECKICKDLVQVKDLLEHTATCFKICEICKLIFLDATDFPQHSLVHSEINKLSKDDFVMRPTDDARPCALCFNKKETESIVVHIKLKHPEVVLDKNTVYSCLLCQSRVLRKDIYSHTTTRYCRSRRICSHCHENCRHWKGLHKHKCQKLIRGTDV